MGKKRKAAFFNERGRDGTIAYVYGSERYEKVAAMTDLYPEVITGANFEEHLDRLQDVEVIFSTWGMVRLTREQIAGGLDVPLADDLPPAPAKHHDRK